MKCFILLIVAVAAVSAVPDQIVNLAAENPKLMANLFSVFGAQYHRQYATPQEGRMRLKLFRNFVKYAAQLNAEYPEVEYGITLFADMTDAEREAMTGFNATSQVGVQASPEEAPEVEVDFVGNADHRVRYNGVKNQANTNACWAFAATAVIEGYQSMITGYKSLSEQMTADCTSGSTIARGGWHNDALNAVRSLGKLASSADYPFRYRDGSCNRNARNAINFRITSVQQTRGDSAVAYALRAGPVAVGMGFDRALSAYKGGIHTDRGCNNVLNHAVTAVGYASNYWLVRNSYGSGWGERGYVRVTRAINDMCRISSYAYKINTQRAQEE